MPQPLLVAVGVITNSDGDILIAKRPASLEQGGLWELPGGKLAPYETGLQALKREIAEEVGLSVKAARPLIRINHTYPTKKVVLDVWKVLAFSGTPKGLEGQPLRWVSQQNLANYQFPQANLPIFQAIQLPEVLNLSPANCLHFTAKQLMQEQPLSFNPSNPKHLPLVVSCASLKEALLAKEFSPNCLALDLQTKQQGFNWQEFNRITEASNLPCYALGHFSISNLPRVFGLGGQGIAHSTSND